MAPAVRIQGILERLVSERVVWAAAVRSRRIFNRLVPLRVILAAVPLHALGVLQRGVHLGIIGAAAVGIQRILHGVVPHLLILAAVPAHAFRLRQLLVPLLLILAPAPLRRGAVIVLVDILLIRGLRRIVRSSRAGRRGCGGGGCSSVRRRRQRRACRLRLHLRRLRARQHTGDGLPYCGYRLRRLRARLRRLRARQYTGDGLPYCGYRLRRLLARRRGCRGAQCLLPGVSGRRLLGGHLPALHRIPQLVLQGRNARLPVVAPVIAEPHQHVVWRGVQVVDIAVAPLDGAVVQGVQIAVRVIDLPSSVRRIHDFPGFSLFGLESVAVLLRRLRRLGVSVVVIGVGDGRLRLGHAVIVVGVGELRLRRLLHRIHSLVVRSRLLRRIHGLVVCSRPHGAGLLRRLRLLCLRQCLLKGCLRRCRLGRRRDRALRARQHTGIRIFFCSRRKAHPRSRCGRLLLCPSPALLICERLLVDCHVCCHLSPPNSRFPCPGIRCRCTAPCSCCR